MGKVQFIGDKDNFENFLFDEDLTDKEKFSFTVTGDDELEDMLMHKFKEEKRKAQTKHGRKKLKLQKSDTILIPNADIEFFAYTFENKIYFGTYGLFSF